MKKRPASILLIVCLLLSLLPASVFAATEYDLYINEFRFTSTNLTYTGEVGSAVYSPQTKTLSLNNLTISTSRTNALIYSNIPDLTINVNGTTTINLLDSSPIGGSDIGQEQANHAFMLEADTTIKGQRGNKSIDKIVINSKSIGVTNPEPDGTTRVGISSASQLTLQDITLSMTDNSATNKVGYASLLRAGGYTTISGCTLDAQKCAHGVFMLEKAAANIAGTEFSMNLSGTLTSGLNFSPGTTNLVSNCSGTINATYPLYSQGSVTVSNAAGGKLTLNGTGAAAVAAENKGAAGGKLLFQDANVVLTSSDSYGIHLQPNASAELKRSTVDVTAPNICVYVDENAKLSLTDGSDQTCRLYLKGTNTAEGGSIGIYAKGSVSFDAGLLSISNVYTAIQNMRTGTVDFSGGNHTLNAAACGYLNNDTGTLRIGGSVNVTVNALIGIQLTKNTGGMLQMSGGTLNLNCGETGLRLQDCAGKTTLSGGRLNITGTGSTPAADGITAYSAIEFSGTEVFFQHCKRDLISLNGANKLTAGKLSLSGSNMGAQLSGGFEMSGGELVSDCANLGVVVTDGTAALKNGKLTLNAGYPLYLQSGGVLDFAGAEVKATATENCALYVDPNTADGASSYRITGGTVVLQSTQAAANAVYTSLPANYGVWVGADEASAAPVSTVTQPVLARNKYARFAEKQSYTLTLVNVKEGSSATVVGGDAITYTAADAPEGQHFSHWELTVGTSTTSVGTNATYTGTMPHSDATLTAVYESCRGGTADCTHKAVCEVCGKPYGDLAAHSYTAETVKDAYLKSAADCDHAAVYYKSCTGCGATSEGTTAEATFEFGTALGHDWGAWTSNGDGTHTHTCSRNPEHTETKDCHGGTADCTHKAVCDDCHGEYGDTADHNYAAETVKDEYLKFAADCDNAAVYYKSCTGCGESSEGTEFEATFTHGEPLGHDWGAWTSNGDGTHTRVCTRDAAHTETKPCHGGTADCTHKPVCEDCGSEYGNTADHNYTAETVDEKYLKSAADCDHAAVYYKSCTGCGATSEGTTAEATFEFGTALGHDWGAWTSNGDGTHTHTCSRNPEHTETKDCHGGTADCTNKAVCDDCGSEYGNTADHNYTAETVDEKYLKSAADCDHTAVYYKSCTGCGATSEGTTAEATFEFGTALGHDEVIDAEKAPTCTQTGLTEGKHCARCNKVLVAQTEIPALGHNVTEGTVTKQPTCTEDGEIVGTCSRCGETNVTAKVDKLPHTEEDVAAVPATCTESGRSAGKYCSVCGEYTEGHELLAPLGHTLRALPETDTLTEGQECSVCHEIVIPQLPKLSDRWTDDGNYDAELYASEPGNWVLCDAADLAAYAKKINDGGSFAGYTVTLANDIDLSGHIWTPIAPNYSSANVGTFDGAMHAIRGMYAESDRYAALFGNVTGSAVLNVTVYGDVRLVTSGYQTKNGNYAAGLIAYATRTVIRNCGFVGTVSMYAPEARFARELGGLTAYHSVGVVENCYAIATVYATGSNAAYAGGIAAELSSFNDGEWSELRGCYTACQFYVDASNVGALVGNTHWNVAFTDCYVQSAYTSGYSARLGGNGNLTYTTLPTEDMTDPDVLLAALNRYVAQDESRLCGAWLLDASVNGGYPFHGLSVWFTPNVEGAKSALRAVHPGTTVTAPTLDIAGYRCVGWYADADFEAEFDFTKPITANTVVYGKYLSNTYSVTYVLNGGENAAANPAEFLCGTGTALADPTRENYLFEGWYTDADFENKVTEIAADTAHDVTLYAKWTLDPNHPHVYGVCKVGSDGLHDHVCTLCGSTFDCEYTETVVAPTCKSAGYTVHTCRSCGNAYIDSVVEGSHKWSTSVVAPTHTEAGCTLYTCSVCGESYKSDYTAPLGHSWDDGKVTKPATCTENGELTHTCSCGETHTAPIPKTDHELADTVTAPTCTELGFTTHACKHCDYSYTDTPVGALGHTWDNGKVAAAPTLTETGTLLQTCTVCKATKESVIPMLSDCDGGEGCPSSAYKDAPAVGNWAHVGIDFVLKSGLFYGTSDTTFSPDGAMTRAMLVTVLYRLEGQPKVTAKNPFSDVADGRWYTDAVVWAAENKIVNGVGEGRFDPDGEITREQMAAILYRYSEFKGVTPSEGKFAAEYPDAGKVSKYALAAMRWANAEKLINGTQRGSTVYLDPQGSATRAQVAAILMRFVQNIL